jgi:Family of unknown function (DUF5706)
MREPADFAWRVHATQETWTTKADTKASVLLAFEGGLGIVATSTADDFRVPLMPAGWHRWIELGGVGLLVLAILITCAALVPSLGATRRHGWESEHNLVYFGHLRLWHPEPLVGRLNRLTLADETEMLARQMVTTSRLNWRKYRCLQLSTVLAMLALITLALSTLS